MRAIRNVLRRFARSPSGDRTTEEIGRRGERLAARRLKRAGYKVLARNYRLGHDEADIVALDPDGATIVIVEVKARTGDFAPPEANIDERKQRNLRRLATRMHGMPLFAGRPIRFDAVTILFREGGPADYRHWVGAF